MAKEKKLARGLRNNNPGNIDRVVGVQWQGMSDDQTGDSRFVVFDSPDWGIRAIARILLTYKNRHGLHTPFEIIGRWAPAIENDTRSYAEAVAERLHVGVNEEIDVEKYEVMNVLVRAIILHENGVQPYDDETIKRGLKLAGITEN